MFRLIILSFVLAVVLADADDDLKMKCRRLVRPGTMQCCKTEIPMPKFDKVDLKECVDMPHDPNSCDKEMCVAKKLGYASDDGTIDKVEFEKTFAKDFESSPTFVEAVKKNCFGGDLDAYGRPEDCELIKIKHCLHIQATNECKEWNDDGPCAGIKDLVKECAKLLS